MRGSAVAAAVLGLLLAGCGWMDGSYVSVEPHQVDAEQPQTGNVQSVGTYVELRSALTGMVDEGIEKALFSLAEYPNEEILGDMERAVEYVCGRYPLGAYAVEAVSYDVGTGLGADALSVDIVYRRSPEELAQIRTVRRMDGVETAVSEALDDVVPRLILQVTGWRDTDLQALVRRYGETHLDRVMELPQVTVEVFPDRGDTRVVELNFSYSTSREELRAMREQVQPVFASAALYVSGQASQWTKFSQLHAFLTERFEYTLAPSVTPAYSLLCQGVGDSRAFAQVYAAMCTGIGLEAQVITGTLDGQERCWNRICIDGVWYHLDLLAEKQFVPKTAEQMTGYQWTE